MAAIRILGWRVCRTVMSAHSALAAWREPLRPLLHWRYSGWLIAIFVASGLGMPFLDQYWTADGCLIAGGVVAIGFWLTSSYLTERRAALTTRASRRNAEMSRKEWRFYRATEWGAVLGIALLTIFSLFYVKAIKWKRISAEVESGLSIGFSSLPGSNALHTQMTITNNNVHEALSARHRLACLQVLAVGNSGTSTISNDPPAWFSQSENGWFIDWNFENSRQSSIPTLSPVGIGGDGVTESCLDFMGFKGDAECVDVKVVLQYFLEEYPKRLQEKRLRFVLKANDNGVIEWHKQPYELRSSYCPASSKQP